MTSSMVTKGSPVGSSENDRDCRRELRRLVQYKDSTGAAATSGKLLPKELPCEMLDKGDRDLSKDDREQAVAFGRACATSSMRTPSKLANLKLPTQKMLLCCWSRGTGTEHT